jgi:hypothetical protein
VGAPMAGIELNKTNWRSVGAVRKKSHARICERSALHFIRLVRLYSFEGERSTLLSPTYKDITEFELESNIVDLFHLVLSNSVHRKEVYWFVWVSKMLD